MKKYIMSLNKSNNFFKNKKVLVVGAAGSIGSVLSEKLAKLSLKQLLILDQDETGIFDLYESLQEISNVDYIIANIRDKERVFEIFNQHKPDIVLHAAAYKHVSLMERYPTEAHKTNVNGMSNVANAAVANRTKKFIFISSDKAANPKSVMGKTKLMGENICKALNNETKFIIVRFGNVLGSRGSVVPIWRKQIAENKPITITDKKMKRYFMSIHEASDLILKAATIGKGGETIILDMGKQMYVEDLAKLMVKLNGKELPIKYIGAKPGEKFKEQLMTRQERSIAKKINGLFIIKNEKENKKSCKKQTN